MRSIFFLCLLSTACQPMEAWEDKLDDSWVNSYRTIDGEERNEVWSMCDDESDDGLGWMRWPAQDDGDHRPKPSSLPAMFALPRLTRTASSWSSRESTKQVTANAQTT
jgi:hypothetical protein